MLAPKPALAVMKTKSTAKMSKSVNETAYLVWLPCWMVRGSALDNCCSVAKLLRRDDCACFLPMLLSTTALVNYSSTL